LNGDEHDHHAGHAASQNAAAAHAVTLTAAGAVAYADQIAWNAEAAHSAITNMRNADPGKKADQDQLRAAIGASQDTLTEAVETVRDGASYGLEHDIERLAVIQRQYD
jgi:N-acetyl-anhydromuramyl-L-alanine amidase AmpD